MTIEDRTRQQYARVFKDWRIEGKMVGRGSQGKTAVFKIIKENSEFTETGALKIINIYESALTGSTDRLDEIEKEVSQVKKNAENELAAMNRMKGHGNIVSYHEFAFEEYKTETVRGVDLLIRMDFYENIGSKIKEGVIFSEAEIIRMGKDISRALADCHSKGILHRDIKPDNIFMNEYGYLLGDFGIAKYSEESDLVASTMAGSYPYAAPEQMKYTGAGKKDGTYDFRVDIYALGLSLYELANDDKIPFATSTYKRAEDIQKRLSGEPLPGLPSVSKDLEAVILKACAYKPEDRFQTAADMLKAFENLSSNGYSPDETFMAVGGYQVPAKEETAPGENRKKKAVIIAVASAAVALIALVIAANLRKNHDIPATEAVESNASVEETVAESVQAEPTVESPLVEGKDAAAEKAETSEAPEFAGTLMSDPFNGSWDERDEFIMEQPVFGDDNYKRKQIKNIYFLTTVPSDKDEPGYDVSKERDGSVLAWFDKSGGGYYDLTIAADGRILLPEDCSYLFAGYSNVEAISFGECIDTSKVTNMYFMFSNCPKLINIEGLENFNTGSVTNMSGMFFIDDSLKSLDLSNFDTKEVVGLYYMFFRCKSLTDLKISSFNTEKVENMAGLFQECYELKELDLSGFQTHNVKTMNNMFAGCIKLRSLDLSEFDTNKVEDLSCMFDGCFELEGVDVSSFSTAAVKNMKRTFANCKRFKELDLSTWDFSSLESAPEMLDGCSGDLKFYVDKQKDGFKNLEINDFPVPIIQKPEM